MCKFDNSFNLEENYRNKTYLIYSCTHFSLKKLIQKLAWDLYLYVLCRSISRSVSLEVYPIVVYPIEVYPIEVYPIEVYPIGKGAVEVLSGLPQKFPCGLREFCVIFKAFCYKLLRTLKLNIK
jgi:hypothetical protein